MFDVSPVNNLPKTDVAGIGGGNHDENIVGANPQEVEPLEFTRDKPIGNFFNYSNTVVGIDDFVTDLKWVHSAVNDSFIVSLVSYQGQASSESSALSGGFSFRAKTGRLGSDAAMERVRRKLRTCKFKQSDSVAFRYRKSE